MNNSTIARTLARGIRLSAVAALLTGLLAVTQQARAGTYVVTTTANSGPGSLRKAINDANNNPGADTITFAASINGIPIVLAGAAGEDFNASGDLDIGDGGELIIQGNGAANTIIDGGGIDRVFHVCPGGFCANTVTFTGVTIRNGDTDYGGGIYNAVGTTMVDGSTISANTADYGGGIYNATGTLNVQSSTIGGAGAGNTAINGGGILNWSGTTTVNGSTVSANTATWDGGGIYNKATLYVQNGSTIGGAGAGNTANNRGGGIFNAADFSAGITTVTSSTVSANGADYGGGIYNYSGTTTVDDSTVSANTAYAGGGINNYSGTTTVDGSTVSANTATWGGGGGIFNHINGTTTVTGSRILNNTATNGGGVYNDSNVAGATSVTGSCIVGNSATSFFNNQPAQQIATGNWWGAATGSNTPGADTVGGNVAVSGHLTAPILGCAPDLQAGNTNDTGGNGTVGTPFHWTLTISNTGITSATFDARQTILEDDLPAEPTYGPPVAGNFVDVTNSANIQCSLAGNTLTCAAAGGDVTLGAITGSFEVTLSVTPGTLATLVNPAGICQVDPDGNVTENDESNNDCPENVVNVAVSTNYLYLPLMLKQTP